MIERKSFHLANVAELADAPDLGSGARKGVGVRPSPFAPPLFGNVVKPVYVRLFVDDVSKAGETNEN
jgi:hypothetical protein